MQNIRMKDKQNQTETYIKLRDAWTSHQNNLEMERC